MSRKPTHKELYERYRDDAVVMRAKKYAHWTLPKLMVDQRLQLKGTNAVLERDYQEIGPLLVNNLASKLSSLLFPASRPFYKIDADGDLARLAEKNGKAAELRSALAKIEKESCQNLFNNGGYEQLVTTCAHLIVTGNALLYRDEDTQTLTAYGVQKYSVNRDGRGGLLDCILLEFTDLRSLPEDIVAQLQAKYKSKYKDPDNCDRVELYTKISKARAGTRTVFKVTQEIDGLSVGEPGTYPEHLCPWQVLTWSLIAGENYGRGLVEDYAGGFARLSDESHSSLLYSVEMGRVVHVVAAGRGANVDELAQAETGQYVSGEKDSVQAIESGDANKYAQMQASIDSVFNRLSKAFMYTGNTRDAERVTAFELKQQALEAETTLGGVYSSLSASMQIPLAHILMLEVDPGNLAGILNKDLKVNVVAGIPALGRQADVQNLAAVSQDAAAIVPVLTKLDSRVSISKLMDVLYAGQSVDSSVIFKSEDEQRQEADAAQQEAAGQQQVAQAQDLEQQQAALAQLQG